ncbi:MAG: hypothetical protein WCW63_00785 [Acholeplasmataceae bacterium]|jgi:hypothetical protein
MGRDLGVNRSGVNRYYYYSSTSVNHNKLVQDAQALGRFDADDVTSFGWHPVVSNNIATSLKEYTGSIVTYDDVGDLRPNMFVEDESGGIFLVSEIPEQDNITSEEISTRAALRTVIVLKGLK